MFKTYIIFFLLLFVLAFLFFHVESACKTVVLQREYERITQKMSNYTRSSIIMRGDAICADGCDRNELRNENYVVTIKDTLVLKTAESEDDLRNISFPKCDMSRLHKFGLAPEGHVFVSRYSVVNFMGGKLIPQEEYCTIEEGPFDGIMLEESGRLKFI